MGCFTQVCTSCNKTFELNSDTKSEEKRVEFGEKIRIDHYYKCTNCGTLNQENYEKSKWKPHDIDTVVEIVKCLQDGKNNKYVIGDVDLKIGEFKKCKKCGYITDIVNYNGCLPYDSNCSTMCEKCEQPKYEKWYENCGDDKCAMHNDLDVEKFRAEDADFEIRRNIVKQIIERTPPKNDGILELDRIAFMFGEMYGKGSINDSRSWVFDYVMLYCARNGLLTK